MTKIMFHISEIFYQIASVTLQNLYLNLFYIVTEGSEEVVDLPYRNWIQQIFFLNSEILQFYEISLLMLNVCLNVLKEFLVTYLCKLIMNCKFKT